MRKWSRQKTCRRFQAGEWAIPHFFSMYKLTKDSRFKHIGISETQ
jgi:hypothetical protein